jgi:hypothetical protein
VSGLLHLLFAPGFFTSPPVRLALLTGGVAAFVSAPSVRSRSCAASPMPATRWPTSA